jgi:putative DNA-invertase from lambdoid prophage Rac
VLALAQRREIDAVLVTELSRWGRSTTDLLATLKELEAERVSVIALNGMALDLSTPHGRMIATVLAGIADDAVPAVMRSSTPDPERTAA